MAKSAGWFLGPPARRPLGGSAGGAVGSSWSYDSGDERDAVVGREGGFRANLHGWEPSRCWAASFLVLLHSNNLRLQKGEILLRADGCMVSHDDHWCMVGERWRIHGHSVIATLRSIDGCNNSFSSNYGWKFWNQMYFLSSFYIQDDERLKVYFPNSRWNLCI
jgi:hypothetical protein